MVVRNDFISWKQNICFIIFLYLYLLVDPVLGVYPAENCFFLSTFATPQVIAVRTQCPSQYTAFASGSLKWVLGIRNQRALYTAFFFSITLYPHHSRNFLCVFIFTFSAFGISENYYLDDCRNFHNTKGKKLEI